MPVFFGGAPNAECLHQVEALRSLLAGEAEILAPVPAGAALPGADAVVLPQVLGEAYRQIADLKKIPVPIVIVTSEFGTVSMWDWEIASYMRSEGIRALMPYNLGQARVICRALGVRRQLRGGKFLVYQDNPGEGFQASIFKRFYWWEEECTARMLERFGLAIRRKSFRDLGAAARAIPDAEAEEAAARRRLPGGSIAGRPLLSAVKLYLALKGELAAEGGVLAAGINCLNESHFSDTTPCLAWNWLYEDMGLTWGCEADTMAMLTHHILYQSLRAPIMMTNLYPFLLGQAALKHERIADFPQTPEPENHVLVAHCGYLGVLPQAFATEWTLRSKVLAIVNENATAIDARLPEGPVTLGKLHPKLDRLSVAEGELEGYAQYPGSDCRNGGVIRLGDGHRFMNLLSSHHYMVMTGHRGRDLELVSRIFDFELEVI